MVLASCVVAITLFDLSVGISEELCVTLLIAFQNSFLGFKFLKNFFLEFLSRDTTLFLTYLYFWMYVDEIWTF